MEGYPHLRTRFYMYREQFSFDDAFCTHFTHVAELHRSRWRISVQKES